MKKILKILLAVSIVVAAAGFVLPYMVFDSPDIIGGAGRPTMAFYMRTNIGQVLLLALMFGVAGALSWGAALGMHRSLTARGVCLSLLCSASAAAGLDCALIFAGCFVMTHPSRHPVALPVSIIGGCIAAVMLWLSLRWLLMELKDIGRKPSIIPCTVIFTLHLLPFAYFFSFCYELAKAWLK